MAASSGGNIKGNIIEGACSNNSIGGSAGVNSPTPMKTTPQSVLKKYPTMDIDERNDSMYLRPPVGKDLNSVKNCKQNHASSSAQKKQQPPIVMQELGNNKNKSVDNNKHKSTIEDSKQSRAVGLKSGSVPVQMDHDPDDRNSFKLTMNDDDDHQLHYRGSVKKNKDTSSSDSSPVGNNKSAIEEKVDIDDPDDADGEEEQTAEQRERAGLPYPEFLPVVFRCLKQTTAPRSWCLKVFTWPYPFILLFYYLFYSFIINLINIDLID